MRKTRNRLLVAGAGTGKTAQLVEQFVGLVEEGVAASKIAAITFTEAAAAELQERIRAARPGVDVATASITTIHGFCASLLRERPIEAGISPHFEVMDELKRASFMDALWEEWLHEEFMHEGIISRALIAEEITRDDAKQLCLQLIAERDLLHTLPEDAAVAREFCRFVAAYQTEKRKAAYLDFQDLLIFTRDLLRTHAHVRKYFYARFAQILVDEFQDTDPLQAEILWLLTCEGAVPEAWWEVTPQPGKLFVVGDPNQSIYRFRRADVSLFEKAGQAMAKADAAVRENLLINYRSVPKILSWVNESFATALTPARENLTAGTDGVSILMASRSLEGEKMPAIREQEARSIASYLRDYRDDIPFGECAILLRVLSDVAIYEKNLVAADIPVIVEGGSAYYRRAEVKNLIAWLRAVDHPHDAVAVVACLRSPFFSVSDQDLALHANAGGNWNYLPSPSQEAPASVQRAFQDLRLAHAQRHLHSVAKTLENFFASSGVLGLYLLKPDGDQRIANLLQMVRTARKLEQLEPLTFSSFAAFLQDQESKLREEAQPIISEGGEAVRIMTMHKSKGLQFRLVILADLFRGRFNKPSLLQVRRDKQELAVKLHTYKSANYAVSIEEEKQAEQAENRRILYVAATRARDRLVLSCFPGTRGLSSTPYALLPQAIQNFVAGETKRVPANLSCVQIPQERLAPRALPPFRGKITADFPPAALQTLLNKRQQFLQEQAELTQSQSEKISMQPSRMRNEMIPANSRARFLGIVMHRVLEHFPFTHSGDWQELLQFEAQQLGLRAAELQTAQKGIAWALQTPILQRARKALELHTELAFDLPWQGRSVAGSIDLLFREADGWVIVDYKSSSIGEEYLPQITLYAHATQTLLQAKVKEIILLALLAQKTASHPFIKQSQGQLFP